MISPMNELFHQRVSQFPLKRHSTKFQFNCPNGISLLSTLSAPLQPHKSWSEKFSWACCKPMGQHWQNVLFISINLLQCWQRVKMILHINWLPCDMKKIPSKFLFFWDIPGPLFPLASACRTGNPFSLHHSEAPTVAVTVLFDQKKAFFSVNQVH